MRIGETFQSLYKSIHQWFDELLYEIGIKNHSLVLDAISISFCIIVVLLIILFIFKVRSIIKLHKYNKKLRKEIDRKLMLSLIDKHKEKLIKKPNLSKK
jgi:hypothetical protein